MTHNKAAFTLAEVLITLGIIGVVAAMTIPNLITSYKIKAIHTKLLKSYSVIKQIDMMMKSDDLDAEMYMSNSNTPYSNVFIKYLTGATNCGSGYKNRCFSVWDTYINSRMSPALIDDGCLIGIDGVVYMFENMYASNSSDSLLWITVDINGYKTKPNEMGIDLFTFEYVNNSFKPLGAPGSNYAREPYDRTYKVINDPNYIKVVLKTLK